MFVPIFTLNLNQKLLPGRISIGEFDGEHPCLVAATTGERVLIHNPHQKLRGPTAPAGRMESTQHVNQDITILNIHQRITALTAGRLDPKSNRDTLLIGTPTNLLAYDVERNADVFHKDVPDGVNALVVGQLGIGEEENLPLAIVGGNCSIQGFDYEGNDPFWTVTGDNVSSLDLIDYHNNGNKRLVVGSEDFEIRIFAEDEILAEITETEAVTAITSVEEGRYGYALANGTVGVYEKTTRWWRIKSKNNATCIFGYDLDGDGVKELITGWSNGKLDARNDRSGEVVFKDNFNHPIAGLAQGDYRMDGRLELVAAATEGEIRGFMPSNPEARAKVFDLTSEQEAIRELTQKKANLILELKNYEENARLAPAGPGVLLAASKANATGSKSDDLNGVIPAQTQLSTSLSLNLGTDSKSPHVEVTLSTSNDTLIRCVLIFAEGIFEGECHVVHPKEPYQSIVVPIYPPRDIPVDLHIKAFVGYRNSKNYHVYEYTRQLPRFSMYCRINGGSPMANEGDTSPSPPPASEPSSKSTPAGHVILKVNERPARVAMWLNQNFLLNDDEVNPDENGNLPDLIFMCLRDKPKELHFQMEVDGKIRISTDDMDLCGDIVQALAEYLGVDDLASSCDFPPEIGKIEQLLVKADELQSVRQRLSSEMADQSGLIRTLIVRTEDSRLMMDMKSMKKWYSQLYDINQDLVSGYKIRVNNHTELMETLKEVNQIIQKAGRLRAGKSKSKVITECRNAIKSNNVNLLLKIIKTGDVS